MKAKTIKSVLAKKFASFTASIEDEEVRKLVEKNTIITGGSIASMLLREPVNDFDMYFRTKEVTAAVANYYAKRFKENPPTAFKDDGRQVEIEVRVLDDRVKLFIKSAGIASEEGTSNYEYFESATDELADEYVAEVTKAIEDGDEVPAAALDDERPKHRPVFLSANAITLSDKVQIITRFFGEPEEIHANYDFIHCTSYWKSWDKELVLPPAALEALLAKELRYVGSRYPLCSIIRTRKFISRGWTINAGQYLKMCFQLSQLDLQSIDVLEDQLIGVDSAYFMQLLGRLREKDGEKVDGAYLTTIIDRIF